MKRIVCLLLVLLLTMTVAIADVDIDYGSLTNEELYELRDNAINELFRRQSDQSVIGATFRLESGAYIVGVDIKPGVYIVTCEEAYENARHLFDIYVETYKNANTYAKDNTLSFKWFDEFNTTTNIVLTEENILVLSGGMYSLRLVA